MIQFKHLSCVLVILFLSGCGESDLSEDYMANAPKIIAAQITNPEAIPGETVTMRLLVAGKDVNQDMTNPVFWHAGDEGIVAAETSPYNVDAKIKIPENILENDNAILDIPVFARIQIGDKCLNAKKQLRITHHPLGKNPQISGITTTYISNEILSSRSISMGDTVRIPHDTANIAFTAIMEALANNGNDTLVYRWYASFSKNSDGKLYVYDDKDTIEELLGEGNMAADFRKSVVYSLKGEDNDEKFMSGIYHIYLVIRDNASVSESAETDRLGTDFFYFTLELL